ETTRTYIAADFTASASALKDSLNGTYPTSFPALRTWVSHDRFASDTTSVSCARSTAFSSDISAERSSDVNGLRVGESAACTAGASGRENSANTPRHSRRRLHMPVTFGGYLTSAVTRFPAL